MNKTSVLTSLYTILQPNKNRLEKCVLNLAVGNPKNFFSDPNVKSVEQYSIKEENPIF